MHHPLAPIARLVTGNASSPAAYSGTLATFATSLLVALVLIPFLRLAFAPLWRAPAAAGSRHGPAARAGGLAVLIAVAALVPMGGDGLAIDWSESRLALGLLLTAGLLAVGMSGDYQRLGSRARLALQAAFGLTATLVGLQPAGVTPDIVAYATGMLILVGCANALRGLDGRDGLAAGGGAITAAFLSLAAHELGAPEWADLYLGLCGALLALLAFNITNGRFKAGLGEGGCLAVGFLLGLGLLRLSQAAAPGTRAGLGCVLALPLLDWVIVAAHRAPHRLAFALDLPDRLHDRLEAAGLTPRQVLVLCWLATAVSGIAMLRALHLLG